MTIVCLPGSNLILCVHAISNWEISHYKDGVLLKTCWTKWLSYRWIQQGRYFSILCPPNSTTFLSSPTSALFCLSPISSSSSPTKRRRRALPRDRNVGRFSTVSSGWGQRRRRTSDEEKEKTAVRNMQRQLKKSAHNSDSSANVAFTHQWGSQTPAAAESIWAISNIHVDGRPLHPKATVYVKCY